LGSALLLMTAPVVFGATIPHDLTLTIAGTQPF